MILVKNKLSDYDWQANWRSDWEFVGKEASKEITMYPLSCPKLMRERERKALGTRVRTRVKA
jgi:hypothetical protein